MLQPQTATVGQQFEIAYQSSTHHLYLSTSPCQYSGATEICPDASSDRVNANNPCTVTFKYPGEGLSLPGWQKCYSTRLEQAELGYSVRLYALMLPPNTLQWHW